jgi:hypothetical protein
MQDIKNILFCYVLARPTSSAAGGLAAIRSNAMSNLAAAKFQPEERSSPGTWAGFLYALRVALRVRRERRLLLGMDDRMLKDLG